MMRRASWWNEKSFQGLHQEANKKGLVSYHDQGWAFSCLRVLGAYCASIKKTHSYHRGVARTSSAIQKKFKNSCDSAAIIKNPDYLRYRLGQVFQENRPLDRQATDFSHSQEERATHAVRILTVLYRIATGSVYRLSRISVTFSPSSIRQSHLLISISYLLIKGMKIAYRSREVFIHDVWGQKEKTVKLYRPRDLDPMVDEREEMLLLPSVE